MISQYRKMAYETWRIAQRLAPMDKGNLRYNAIFLKDFKLTKDGGAEWRINYSSRNASYIDPVNYGYTTKGGTKIKGQHFIMGATLNIARYMNGQRSLIVNAFNQRERDKDTGFTQDLGKAIGVVRQSQSHNISEAQRADRMARMHKSIEIDTSGRPRPYTDVTDWRVSR